MGVDRSFRADDEHADVCVVIVTYNSADDIGLLLGDLRRAAADLAIRVIVVDNGSADGTRDIVRSAGTDIGLVEERNIGYAGGVNAATRCAGSCDFQAVINPDLRLPDGALSKWVESARRAGAAAVAPAMVHSDGTLHRSLHREPTVFRTLGDSLLGDHILGRPAAFTERVSDPRDYSRPGKAEWVTGAALLLRQDVVEAVGPWDERFFLYSEETDYCRRIRELGHEILFDPDVTVIHHGAGSGTSRELDTLLAVNKVRYAAKWHSDAYAEVVRSILVLATLLRGNRPGSRHTRTALLDPARWDELPKAEESPAHVLEPRSASVVIPAHNEATVLSRTMAPLADAAARGALDVIVVANGCTDDTARIAQSYPGVRALELADGNKAEALNAGLRAASVAPCIFLDADITVTEKTVFDLVRVLREPGVLAARPDRKYDFSTSTFLVRRYYRCRRRVPMLNTSIWGAGIYALNSGGLERIGRFPDLTADDLWLDLQFSPAEYRVVRTDPAVVTTPVGVPHLTHTLKRIYRTNREVAEANWSSPSTAVAVLRTIRGPVSALDALVYLSIAGVARLRSGLDTAERWERDESSR
ncbi:glycosyltransferase family 2 protein [Dietzia sp. B32]|uniref:glycosyltransferase family 2 protein n=1 Tax=Dietzia sp. B32 TaxID=2915130 RepID=UPI0021AD8BC0|nr:glycosyltransferase family 2 protein [Dietzia sp. B32]UVE96040.1 glycosyltransferase family 2 protein [Dietzia sp. B32]